MKSDLTLLQKVVCHINYRDVFNAPVSIFELQQWLAIGRDDETQLRQVLNALVNDGLIETPDGVRYCVAGRSELFELKRAKQRLSRRMFSRHTHFIKWLAWIPFVRLIGISGSIAVENATPDVTGRNKGLVDLDVFIVTSRHTLWVVYYPLRVLSHILLLFQGGKHVYCFNYAMDYSFLEIHNKNVFTATELYSMKVLYNHGDTYKALLKANQWATDYYSALHVSCNENSEPLKSSRIEQSLYSCIHVLNFLMFVFYQITRAVKKLSLRPLIEIRLDFNPSMGLNYNRVCPPGGGYEESVKERFIDNLQRNFPTLVDQAFIEHLFPRHNIYPKSTWDDTYITELKQAFVKYGIPA